MVKPLHAGVAARNGVMAARLAQQGFTASELAIDGPQGYLAAMDSERPPADLADVIADLGSAVGNPRRRGISVKLYPSCAATHPPLDVLLQLVRAHCVHRRRCRGDRRRGGLDDAAPADSRPARDMRSKPSSACRSARPPPSSSVIRRSTRSPSEHIPDPRVQQLLPRVTLRANAAFDAAAPLSQARVTVRLRTDARSPSRPTARADIRGG